MSQANMMANIETHDTAASADANLDQVSQSGWNRFTRFLTITVIAVIVVMLVIGAFTVWS